MSLCTAVENKQHQQFWYEAGNSTIIRLLLYFNDETFQMVTIVGHKMINNNIIMLKTKYLLFQ